ncbi:hypothetical protein ACNKHR_02325 [Shigella flexneri]
MVGTGKTFALDAVGAWAIESLVYFFVGALAIAFLGGRRYAIVGNAAWRVQHCRGRRCAIRQSRG